MSTNSLLFRIYIKLKDKFDPKKPASHEEVFCSEICLKLIQNPSSRLTYAPISGKRFIKNDEKNMFIVINHRTVDLINHVYGYSIFLDDEEVYRKVIDEFDGTLEAQRQALEDEMTSNVRHSLQKILDRVSE